MTHSITRLTAQFALTFAVILFGNIALTQVVWAQDTTAPKNNDTKDVSAVVGGMEFRSGDALIVSEPIDRDLFLAGSSIRVEQPVTGDLFAAGQDVTIDTTVTGDLRVAASSVTIRGVVGGNVLIFASTVKIDDTAQVQGHVNLYGATIVTDGTVGKSYTAAGESVLVNGALNGEAKIDANTVEFGQAATIAGAATVKGANEPKIATDAQRAQIQYTAVDRNEEKQNTADEFWTRLRSAFFWYVALSLIGIAVLLLWGVRSRLIVEALDTAPFFAFVKGFIALVVTPVVVVLAAVTIIGLPLSLFIAGVYIAALAIAKIFVGAWIGNKLLPGQSQEGVRGIIIQFLVGFLILSIVTATPYIGGILGFIATILGLGALVSVSVNAVHHKIK
jgi:hypothetical protein